MDNLINEIRSYIESYGVGIDDVKTEEAFVKDASTKLQSLLYANSSCFDGYEYNQIVKEIDKFLSNGDINKSKLQNFCLDFFDPTILNNESEKTVNQSFLHENELYQLYSFVKKHKNDKTFGDAVYEIMGQRNMTPPQVYRQAKLRRQDFSRITSYKVPGIKKTTVWNVIVGLHCTLDEADYLLFCAGYVRRKNIFDLTLEYFIVHKNYDILTINLALAQLGQKTLACYIPINDNDPF